MKRLAYAAVVIGVWLAGVLPAAAQVDECMNKGGLWDPNTGRCDVSAVIEIHYNYPIMTAGYANAEALIDQFFADQRAQFLGALVEYGFYPVPGPLTQTIDYETVFFSERVVSLVFSVSEYTGGAHPNGYYVTFTFNLATDQALSLADVFTPGADYLGVIAPLAQQAVTAQLGEYADPQWIAEGTAPDPANYAVWAVTADALALYFNSYQVAPYAAGPQIVTIPLADLAGILAPPFSG